ncbi:hypothetical protein PP182_04055 [Maribacter sp. PR1]|uniref:Glutamyl-tRNA synthetase n=1 Tax=Maribacter cobaltidurans TaxID=1178778 RepID=A0ABU7IQJ1_9FLAO|nr:MULTISPECIES: hypothetical protein [Maribacter]MDC6387838.1 hypothetical protein [Maribacter sp. PR1]MEE1975227.1 hypothetical protein [Maribacter cobaltidurans]
MQSYSIILEKLNEFIRKHYTQKLIKGVILFTALGLLFFLAVVGIEFALWLNSTGRLILLMAFLLVEGYLLYKYIFVPVFYLFKIKKGITTKDASLMIGKHFPEVGDKLYNLLDLADNPEKSELLLASIEQRSEHLKPIPFKNAVNTKEPLRYIKFALIPLLFFGVLWVSGNWETFFGSYTRVVNYNLAYEPPDPFRFELLSPQLQVVESEPFTFQVATSGEVKPENVFVVLDGREILLQEVDGIYQYTLSPPINTATFNFKGNNVRSRDYQLIALKAPAISDFNMRLDYPNYLKKNTEIIKSTGNALLPEGTKVTWEIKGQDTEEIKLITRDTSLVFNNEQNNFTLSKPIYSNLDYQLSTSNSNVRDYETLGYSFQVIKDGYPTIKVEQVLDSLEPNISYYSGEATDDYGLRKVELIYYEQGNEEIKKALDLNKPQSNFHQFYYTFPSGLNLEEGKNYAFYFQVTDNDGIHGGKKVKSGVFTQEILDGNQLKNKELESQQSIINNLDKSLEKAAEQRETLKEINALQKEKNRLDFNDKNQVKDFLEKQEQQEELMQKFSKELKDNLEKGGKDDKLNQLLQERLERQEIEARKNQKLLEELNKIADKINKDELGQRLEELGKKQQNSERSLEQLVELTKRYYVTEKASQLANDLEKLAEQQEILSQLNIGKDFSEKEQQKLNEDFENIAKELEELQKDNRQLKKPVELNIDKDKEAGVKDNQNTALEEIKKHQGNEQSSDTESMEQNANKAKQNQKSAAEKMKEMSEELGKSSMSGGSSGSSAAEDAEMLRQILDNLIIFSFKQENLFDKLSIQEREDISQYSETVRNQKELRGLFEHVDDSLFALSLRQAELSEFVNEQITEVYYNIDKSLESITEGQIYQGVSYQKYVLTASNSLADFLAHVLENMQQSMQMGKGSGQSQEGFQLPDIIKQQQSVGEKMGQSGSQGQEGQKGEGKQGESGENGEGKQGENGQGTKGKKGEQGGQGQSGSQGEGENGKGGEGQNGNGNREGGSGQGQGSMSESELQEIYQIYQEQQRIKQELENQLENLINDGDRKLGEKLIRQMEDFQNELLENGITQRTITKANTIQYELLKLENAALKQGRKSERESNTNKQDFTNPITTKPSLLDNYRNEIEILNRQALPLRQNFQNRVKEYFKDND